MATGALVIAIVGASGAASVSAESADSRAQSVSTAARVTAPVLSGANRSARPRACSARGAVRFYSRRLNEHRAKMGAGIVRHPRRTGQGSCPRHLAHALQRKAYATRTLAERWVAEHVLADFRVRAGARAWRRAVQEAQRPYPGTRGWLMSCSASEGGWGRWVPNSQGSGVGGWLQFMPGTFSGFFWHARVDVARRGYIVPGSASSWYSPLGQALAGAWGITHGMRHHWAGRGCW